MSLPQVFHEAAQNLASSLVYVYHPERVEAILARLPAAVRSIVEVSPELPICLAVAAWAHCLAPQFFLEPLAAYDLGFWHGLGRPLARKQGKGTKVTFTGYAQLSAALAQFCGQDEEFCWALNHHTDAVFRNHDLLALTTSRLAFPQRAFLQARCLATAVSRVHNRHQPHSEDMAEPELQLGPLQPTAVLEGLRYTTEKCIVVPLGLSGCGKTRCVRALQAHYGDRVAVAERDQCYYDLAAEHCPELVGAPYAEIYAALKAKGLSEVVQSAWVDRLSAALEADVDVVVIDTTQTLYPARFCEVLPKLTERAWAAWTAAPKLAWYGLPVTMLGLPHTAKLGTTPTYPQDRDPAFAFPHLITETQEVDSPLKFLPLFGTASIAELMGTVDVLLSARPDVAIPAQVDLLSYVRELGITRPDELQKLEDAFPPGVLERTVEHSSDDGTVVTIGYRDGFQRFNQRTRDYRGESLLFTQDGLSLFRASLPVMAETYQFKQAMPYWPYLAGVREAWPHLIPVKLRNQLAQVPVRPCELYVTPKVDGSLFNATYHPAGSEGWLLASSCSKNTILELPDGGVLILGSKGRVFAFEVMHENILAALKATFGDTAAFARHVCAFLQAKVGPCETATLHFEQVPRNPHAFLAVYYGQDECVYLGLTVVRAGQKQFFLPKEGEFPRAVSPQPLALTELPAYYEAQHARLLAGDASVHPEGFVCHLVDCADGTVLSFKYKFPEYYAAHKPNSRNHQALVRRLHTDECYVHLRERFNHFRHKPQFLDQMREPLEAFVQKFWGYRAQHTTKKAWALFCKDHADTAAFASAHLSTYRDYGFPVGTAHELARWCFARLMTAYNLTDPGELLQLLANANA